MPSLSLTWTEVTTGVSRYDTLCGEEPRTVLRADDTIVTIDHGHAGSAWVEFIGQRGGQWKHVPWPMLADEAIAYWTLVLIGEPTDLTSITSMCEYLEQRAA